MVYLFSAVICLSLVVIVLPGLWNMCARACTSSEVPELPSNITHGLCFDPRASHSPQPAPKHIVINVPVVIFWVGDTQIHTSLLSLQCFHFTHSLPHFQSQCPPTICRCVRREGPVTAREGLALLPTCSAIRSLKALLPLLLPHSPRLLLLFFFQILRERRSHLHFCERLPGICSILLGFREVGDGWCML